MDAAEQLLTAGPVYPSSGSSAAEMMGIAFGSTHPTGYGVGGGWRLAVCASIALVMATVSSSVPLSSEAKAAPRKKRANDRRLPSRAFIQRFLSFRAQKPITI